MASDILAAIAALGSIIACLLLLLVLRRAHDAERLRLLAEQGLAGQRAEGETTRAHLASAERALGGRLEQMRATRRRRSMRSRSRPPANRARAACCWKRSCARWRMRARCAWAKSSAR